MITEFFSVDSSIIWSGILKENTLQQPSESNALSGWLLEQYEATNRISQVNWNINYFA